MGIYEYKRLELKEQLVLLWNSGVFLHNRKEDNLGFSLYSLYNFYAEVHLNNKTNEIEKVRTFKSINPLEPYLDSIDITKLNELK